MDLFTIYTVWLSLFSLAFTFLPVFVILDWRRRGTAEGFSSVNFVLPMLMMSCWCRHGLMTGDNVNIYLNLVNLVIFSFYVAAFAYYQPMRKYLYLQIISLLLTLYSLFNYVDSYPNKNRADVMAAVAAFTQIVGLAGGLYDIKRAIDIKTTEYIPAQIQLGTFALTIQWTIFGVITRNYYMAVANFAGLVVNVIMLSLYVKYPPKTWVVPILNVGGKEKATKKKQ